MGGSADKEDQVSQNAIWTEHCVREARCLRMNLEFGGLRSPSKSVPPEHASTPCLALSASSCSLTSRPEQHIACVDGVGLNNNICLPMRTLFRPLSINLSIIAVAVLPSKPTQVQPGLRAPSEQAIKNAKETLANLCIVQNEESTPDQRFVLPVTTNQEFGFFSTPLIAKNPLFHHARNSCEVTSYADRYYSMSGRSPYAKKPDC